MSSSASADELIFFADRAVKKIREHLITTERIFHTTVWRCARPSTGSGLRIRLRQGFAGQVSATYCAFGAQYDAHDVQGAVPARPESRQIRGHTFTQNALEDLTCVKLAKEEVNGKHIVAATVETQCKSTVVM